VVHAYFGNDSEILWDIVRTKVPVLARTVTVMRRADTS
jgi:uncharacterized protein with HEPN domain